MSPDELRVSADAMIIKIYVITGWAIPADEFAEELARQFYKKMQEGYSNVNPDEIEYAFRTYGTTVKDWGKSMNLALIDEVMIPYLEQRREVSKIEEQKKQKQIEGPKETMSEETFQSWYDQTAADFKVGKITLEFLPPMLSDWLISKGEIDHEQFFKRAAIEIGKR